MGRPTEAGRSPRKPAGFLRDHHRREPQWLRLLPLLVVAAGVVVYLNGFSGTFLFDDTYHIVKSAKIRSLWPPWALMATQIWRRRPTFRKMGPNYGSIRLQGRATFRYNC